MIPIGGERKRKSYDSYNSNILSLYPGGIVPRGYCGSPWSNKGEKIQTGLTAVLSYHQSHYNTIESLGFT